MRQNRFRIACAVGVIGLSTPVMATEQVYHPVSPTFGGNPLNGTFLLSTAQAQGAGVNSGNQGPNLTPLTDALSGLGSGGNSGNGGNNGSNGSGGGGGGNSGASGATNAAFRSTSFRSQLNANPTAGTAPMP